MRVAIGIGTLLIMVAAFIYTFAVIVANVRISEHTAACSQACTAWSALYTGGHMEVNIFFKPRCKCLTELPDEALLRVLR